jgi:YfiH family protein
MMNNPKLTEYKLGASVRAFSTTRHGGVSEGNYGEMNINRYCGDDEAHIAMNRQLLADTLAITPDHILMPHQTHSDEVRQIAADFLQLPVQIQQMVLEGVDAVMTDLSGICIGISTADCIPILLYDAEHHAVCAIHSGWRGTVKRILEKTLVSMQMTYHTNLQQLQAVIGPGISLEHFEVGDEVYKEFASANFPLNDLARQYPNSQSDAAQPLKWHIDLPGANKYLMESLGVPVTNIQMSGICTYSRSDDYFSARRLGIDSGRIFTGILLQ